MQQHLSLYQLIYFQGAPRKRGSSIDEEIAMKNLIVDRKKKLSLSGSPEMGKMLSSDLEEKELHLEKEVRFIHFLIRFCPRQYKKLWFFCMEHGTDSCA